MAARKRLVSILVGADDVPTKRQKSVSSSDFAANANYKTSASTDRTDDNDAIVKTVTKSSTPTCDEASDVVPSSDPPGSESTAKDTGDDSEEDVEYDEGTKAQMNAENAAKINHIRTAMSSAFPRFIFITEFEAEDDDVWQPDPVEFGTLSANKTLDGALDQVADYFEHWGAMQFLVKEYRKEQAKRGNVSLTKYVSVGDQRAALLDLFCWSEDESRGSTSISAKVTDAGTNYTITIKRVPLRY